MCVKLITRKTVHDQGESKKKIRLAMVLLVNAAG